MSLGVANLVGMRKPLGTLLVALAVLGSCAGSDVTRLGPLRPARPADCAVEILPGKPTIPVSNLAQVRVRCDAGVGRDGCLAELRRRACELGGDMVYDFSDSAREQSGYVTGTVAWRGPSASAAPGLGSAPPP